MCKEGDHEELQRVKDFNEDFEKHVSERLSGAHESVQNLIGGMREVEEQTLSKLLLVDSKGQHKDRKNDGRALKAKAETAVFEDVNDASDIYDDY